MPRNRTEKVRPIAGEGWLIGRALPPYNPHHEPECITVIIEWSQAIADECERMWSLVDTLKSANPPVESIRFSTRLHALAFDEGQGDLDDWLGEPMPDAPADSPYDRMDSYYDGGFFSLEQPPLVSPSPVSIHGTACVSDIYIDLSISPHHGGTHETDGLIYRADSELFLEKTHGNAQPPPSQNPQARSAAS